MDLIPVVNVIILRGWRVAVVRRMAWKRDASLPAFRPLQFFLDGLFLWTLTSIYTVIPLILISLFGFGGIVALVKDMYTLALIVMGQTKITFTDFVLSQLIDTIAGLGIEIVWIAVSLPLHRVAMMRFAITGRHRSFLQIYSNGRFLLQHFGEFVSIWVFSVVTGIIFSVVSASLTITIMGALLIPLVILPTYYWSSGYEYGELAFKLRASIYGTNAPPSGVIHELIS